MVPLISCSSHSQVVYGLYDYKRLLPNNSVINVLDFKSVKHLAQYLKSISEDKHKYYSYLKWKSNHCVHNLAFDYEMGLLCDKLRGETNGQTIDNPIHKQMEWRSENDCMEFNFKEY